MTMASSTTKPVAIVSAIRVRLLIEKSARYITPKVPTRDSGTATLGMMVAGILRRNRKITITTSTTASINSNFRSEEHTSELQSHSDLVCRLLLEKKKKKV